MTLTRRLAYGTAQLTTSSAGARLLSVISMPILTALLSPRAYGSAALVTTAISLASVLALAGIDVSYIGSYHRKRGPSGIQVEHYCWRFAIAAGCATGAAGALAWWLIGRAVSLDQDFLIVLAIGIVLSVLQAMAQARARLAARFRDMSLATLGAAITATVASIAIAWWWRQDAFALLLPMLFAGVMTIAFLGVPSITVLVKRSTLTPPQAFDLIKIGLPAVVTAPMYWLLSSSDRWFLEHYYGTAAVGVYSIGYSVAIVGAMVNGAIVSVWLPEATREYEEDPAHAQAILGRLMTRLIAAMAIIWLAAATAGGDVVRWLADERFHASARYVPYIAGGVFFYGVSQLALSTLVLVNKLRLAAAWWLVGGVVCTVLNLSLVGRYGGAGAALTQCISFAFIAIGTLISMQRAVHLDVGWRRLSMVGLLIVAAGGILIPPWSSSAPFSLIMKLPGGGGAAAVLVWLVAPDWCMRGVRKLRRRYQA